MAKFVINKTWEGNGSDAHVQRVEAKNYHQDGDYFVFLSVQGQQVLAIQSRYVHTIDIEQDDKK